MARRSPTDRGRSAERIPIGIPMTIHTTAAPTASCPVMIIRWKMIGLSAVRVVKWTAVHSPRANPIVAIITPPASICAAVVLRTFSYGSFPVA